MPKKPDAAAIALAVVELLADSALLWWVFTATTGKHVSIVTAIFAMMLFCSLTKGIARSFA